MFWASNDICQDVIEIARVLALLIIVTGNVGNEFGALGTAEMLNDTKLRGAQDLATTTFVTLTT